MFGSDASPNQGMAPGLLISAGRDLDPNRVQNACCVWLMCRAVLAKRNPILLFLLFRLFLLRLAERQLLSLLFHEPPRNTAVGAIPGAKIAFFKKKFSATAEFSPLATKKAAKPPEKERKKGG